MSDIKHINGLQLLSATRVSVTNHNPNEHSISVNGQQLSYSDIDLGALKLTDSKAYALDESDGKHYEILHTNSNFTPQFEEEEEEEDDAPTGGKVLVGQIIPSGDNLFKQQSPAPFAYIDTTGRLGSANLWHNLFVANIMGYVDVDKATNTYRHGLCPQGSADHGGLFLRKDGQWGSPSLYTGSVSETFLSLNDTPTTYTENINKYLRVSYAEGGSIIFDQISTEKVPETTNLYYTEARVNDRIASKLQDKTLNNISVSGTITCNEILAESDRKLKKNIKDLKPEVCLEIINDIRPRCYTFQNDPTNKKRYGVIAQELKKVVPHLVNYSEAGLASVNYLEMIPILISSIQQLKQEISCLKNDVCK
jgi:hypothetical protein